MDTVNHPSHYTSGKFEVIDIIESVTNGQDLKPFEAVLVGNIVKYVSRFTHKNGVEDLKKASWYLQRLISEFEKSQCCHRVCTECEALDCVWRL